MFLIYPEMRRVAAQLLARERGEVSLQATELVHETYLRLAGQERASFQSRAHFLSISARMVRRVLVDHWRRKHRRRRGGHAQRIDLEQVPLLVAAGAEPELLDLNDALERFEAIDPEAARLVELRFFAGLTLDEAALTMGIGRTAIVETWQYARAWLKQAIRGEKPQGVAARLP